MRIQAVGLDKMLKKLDPALIGEPLRKFFERASITVQSEARERTPVDWGTLRNSIVYEIDKGEVPHWAKIGPLKAKEGSALWFQARAMEFGTGSRGQEGISHRAEHHPPAEALDVWAKRHGFKSGRQVAAIISSRGGLKARKFLQGGLKASMGPIRGFLDRLANDIQRKWGK